jgi:hypothetical protein
MTGQLQLDTTNSSKEHDRESAGERRTSTHHTRLLVDLGGQILLTHALPLGVLLVLTTLGDGGTYRGRDGRGRLDLVLHV